MALSTSHSAEPVQRPPSRSEIMLRDALRRDDQERERERRPHHHHHPRPNSRRRSSNSRPRPSKSSPFSSPSHQDFDNCNDPSSPHAPLSSSSSSFNPHLVRNKSTSSVNSPAIPSTSPPSAFDNTATVPPSTRRHTSPSPPSAPRPRHLRAFSHTHIIGPNNTVMTSNTVPSSPQPLPTSGQGHGAPSPLYGADREPFSSSPTAFTTPHDHVLRMRVERVLRRGEQEQGQERERERERERARQRQRPPLALRGRSKCRDEEEPNSKWKWAGEHVDRDLVQMCSPASRSCSSVSASDHDHELEHDRESERGSRGGDPAEPLPSPPLTPPSDSNCFGSANGNELLSRAITSAAATAGAHFNVRQASDLCRKMDGYVSFASVEGLGEPEDVDDDSEPEPDHQEPLELSHGPVLKGLKLWRRVWPFMDASNPNPSDTGGTAVVNPRTKVVAH